MKFMTTEGDRAGVEIPSHVQKATNVIHAMIKRLEGKETYSIEDLNEAYFDLTRARSHLGMEE